MKFKAGDRVRRKSDGELDVVKSVPGMPEYDEAGYSSPQKGFVLRRHSWEYQKDWERFGTNSSPKFVLQYELDSDPFELFVTEKELRTRIAELAERSDLKRDSIKVYDIKRVRTVKLGVKIMLSK